MADRLDESQPTPDPTVEPGAMEWLVDTLDENAASSQPRGCRVPLLALLALFAGILVIGGLIWLLIGPPLSASLPFGPEPTATPTMTPIAFAEQPTPTPIPSPTLTPTATPNPDLAFQIGARVAITGTGTRGVRLRAGPGLSFVTLEVYQDGDAFFVMPGDDDSEAYPVLGDDLSWWRLRAPDGLIGWTVEDFLVEAPLVGTTPTVTSEP